MGVSQHDLYLATPMFTAFKIPLGSGSGAWLSRVVSGYEFTDIYLTYHDI